MTLIYRADTGEYLLNRTRGTTTMEVPFFGDASDHERYETDEGVLLVGDREWVVPSQVETRRLETEITYDLAFHDR